MTLNQLNSLDEQELSMLLYICNVLAPLDIPKIQFEPRQLTWIRHDMLINKLLNSFKSVNLEGHATYISLMQKLGVKIEIKHEEVPLPATASAPTTGSV